MLRFLYRAAVGFALVSLLLACQKPKAACIEITPTAQTSQAPTSIAAVNIEPEEEAQDAKCAQSQAQPPAPATDEDDPRKTRFVAPQEVPLAGEIFLASDRLPERLNKWQAHTKKKSFQKKIVVEKSKRTLTVFVEQEPLIRYPVELGFAPTGDKEREGDGKTPEGEFYVCTRNEASQFHRFLGISYPRPKDAKRGLSSGMISKEESESIVSAHKEKKLPPWKTALGGEVGIHGGGRFSSDGKDILGYDWTLGCVALTDEQSYDLFYFAELGTPVLILP